MDERDITDGFPLFHYQQTFPSLFENAALLINIQHVVNAEGRLDPFWAVVQLLEISDLVRQTDTPDTTPIAPVVMDRLRDLSGLQQRFSVRDKVTRLICRNSVSKTQLCAGV